MGGAAACGSSPASSVILCLSPSLQEDSFRSFICLQVLQVCGALTGVLCPQRLAWTPRGPIGGSDQPEDPGHHWAGRVHCGGHSAGDITHLNPTQVTLLTACVCVCVCRWRTTALVDSTNHTLTFDVYVTFDLSSIRDQVPLNVTNRK